MRVSAGLILLFLPVFPASAFADGMYLCRFSTTASEFWNDVTTARQVGVELDKATLKSIADKNACPIVSSDSFKPIDYVAGQMLLTDGHDSGWADPRYYVMFVNHKNP
jgi:hypothetical protein